MLSLADDYAEVLIWSAPRSSNAASQPRCISCPKDAPHPAKLANPVGCKSSILYILVASCSLQQRGSFSTLAAVKLDKIFHLLSAHFRRYV